jgi:hypothetical protein
MVVVWGIECIHRHRISRVEICLELSASNDLCAQRCVHSRSRKESQRDEFWPEQLVVPDIVKGDEGIMSAGVLATGCASVALTGKI